LHQGTQEPARNHGTAAKCRENVGNTDVKGVNWMIISIVMECYGLDQLYIINNLLLRNVGNSEFSEWGEWDDCS
jgi:hypothetical protein